MIDSRADSFLWLFALVPADAKTDYGLWALLPAAVAVVLAFLTREAILSLFLACALGVVLKEGPFAGLLDLPGLFERSMGTQDFIWVLLVEVCIGILVAFFMKTDSTEEFARVVERRVKSRNQIQLVGWFLGMLIFFSDYFSPLLTGPVMRQLTDRAKISREKLAYICDSTSAPMCVLIPFSAWGVYIAGLLVGIGTIETNVDAIGLFLRAVVCNFYAILAVGMVGLIAVGWLPDFGPMRRAERRAMEEGKLIADGASPMMSVELVTMEPSEHIKRPRLFVNFAFPVALVITIVVGSFAFGGKPLILEAFMLAVLYLGLALRLQSVPFQEIMTTAVQGIKGIVPAILLLGLAYSINTITRELGAAQYVLAVTEGWLTPMFLPAITFTVCALISFATGTSWGTYAIVTPICVPLAFQFSGGEVDLLVLATVGALAGGGVFGDHCSPMSDTTILSSFGAASDHIDHVRTQLPYACVAAGVALGGYLILGFFA